MIRLLVRISHCSVASAMNGAEALKMFETAEHQHQPFSIIFMDYNMPGMDGVKCVQKIVEQWGRKFTILGITADLDEQLTTLFIKAGAQTLLHKPINIPQLKIWF